jgi:enoyl-CoA hydratase/carnithine racemase
MTREITTIKRDGVLQIDFLRPTKKNAFTKAMYQDMADALKDGASDDAIKVILFVGQPEIFTAGNDVEDFLNNPPSGEDSPVFQFLHQLSHAEKPVIDLVYAADNSRFSLPFVALGLVPEAASSYLLPRLFGYQLAAEKLLLGEPFGPDEALRAGLVTKVLPLKEVVEFAQTQAKKLVALPAASLRATKKLMKSDLMPMIKQRMGQEGELFRERLGSPEAKEALSAFLEKRKPDFSAFA